MNEIHQFAFNGRTYEYEAMENVLELVAGFDRPEPCAKPAKPTKLTVVSANPRPVQGVIDAADLRGFPVEQINPVLFLRRLPRRVLKAIIGACKQQFIHARSRV